MSKNLPETEIPDVREYLFVDTARVRMLVAQLQGGLPENLVSTTSRSHKLSVGTKILGIEKDRGRASEDVIALGDLHVSMLEDDAEALGMLLDFSDAAKESDFWKRGGGRKRLKPGSLIRVTAPTRLMDPRSITNVWRNFDHAFRDDDGDEGDEKFSVIMDGIDALYGEHLSLSIFPRGADDSPTKAFLGVIDHRSDFTALDRASLFSRLGPEPTELTSILQISRIPQEGSGGWTVERLVGEFGAAMAQAGTDRLDRRAIDQFLNGIMRLTEEYGLQSAPSWPSMAVTPLAIYRQVPAFD